MLECVDMDNVSIVDLVKPVELLSGEKDTIGASKEISVILKNESDRYEYENTNIYAWIENLNGDKLEELQDVITKFNLEDTSWFTFNNTYTVPNESEYVIRVFIEKVDSYQEDDTLLSSQRETELISRINTSQSDLFSLSQNIPNPTNGTTFIEYTLPEAGEVIFNLQTISSQILYTQVIPSAAGKQVIELNTENFAAGVYFYSMEYKGEKIVKRLVVKN